MHDWAATCCAEAFHGPLPLTCESGSITALCGWYEQAFREALEGLESLVEAVANTDQLHHELEQQSRALQALHTELSEAKHAHSEDCEIAHARSVVCTLLAWAAAAAGLPLVSALCPYVQGGSMDPS